MPNAKIYVDQTIWNQKEDVVSLLPQLRELFCRDLNVGPGACQLAILPVHGLPDQPQVNVELHILPAPDRSRELLGLLAAAIQKLLASVVAGQIAVRIATLDPQTYVALKS